MKAVVERLTYNSYQTMCNTVMEKDKMVYTLLVALEVLSFYQSLLIKFFLTQVLIQTNETVVLISSLGSMICCSSLRSCYEHSYQLDVEMYCLRCN